MLVMTRRLGEEILLGDDIRIVVLSVDADRVKIGIEAPATIKILRAELVAAVRATNLEATQTAIDVLQGMTQLIPQSASNPVLSTDVQAVSVSAPEPDPEKFI